MESEKDYCMIMMKEFEQAYKEANGKEEKAENINFDIAFPFFSIMLKPKQN